MSARPCGRGCAVARVAHPPVRRQRHRGAPGLPRPARCGPGGHRRRVPGQTLEQAQRLDVSSGFPCERGLRCTQGAPESRTEAPQGGEASGGKAPARRGRAGQLFRQGGPGRGVSRGEVRRCFLSRACEGGQKHPVLGPGPVRSPRPPAPCRDHQPAVVSWTAGLSLTSRVYRPELGRSGRS